MGINLRTGLIILSLGALILILLTVSKRKLNIKYSIVWILWALFSLLMAIFPDIFYGVAALLGIELPVNAVFLIMTALLYLLTFYVYIMISKHNEQIVKLTYEVSVLKKENEELKNRKWKIEY